LPVRATHAGTRQGGGVRHARPPHRDRARPRIPRRTSRCGVERPHATGTGIGRRLLPAAPDSWARGQPSDRHHALTPDTIATRIGAELICPDFFGSARPTRSPGASDPLSCRLTADVFATTNPFDRGP